MHKSLSLLTFLTALSTNCLAQFSVKFVVKEAASTNADSIFCAGTFNGWNPADKKYAVAKKENNIWELTLKDTQKGEYNFKFTQGSWDRVEDSTNGADIANRTITVLSDTNFYFTIQAWKKAMDNKPRKHTASKNVHILSDSFYMPELKRYRKIWIYLPANYKRSKQHYPVLYMHDGQNLFDENTAPFGEWGVDETLDSLQKVTRKYAIVVGIDHGDDKRLVEYNPDDTKEYGKGEGDAYSKFLVKTLKPFIDKHYRTKVDAANTGIAGSSLGGLISTYAMLKHPQVFGAAGLFSPAYWIAPSINTLAEKAAVKTKALRFWFYGGGKEGFTMLKDMEKVQKIVSAKYVDVQLTTDKNAKHNEMAWRKWFPMVLYLVGR
jgi:predicted alpha/beta superfamily hydrolase